MKQDKDSGGTGPKAVRDGLGFPVILGLLVVTTVFGGLIAWSILAPIDGAVTASGNIQVESNRKTIEHLEGGIVSEIRVSEGEFVESGALLIRLDDAVEQANLALVTSQLAELMARRARLRAERDDAETITFLDALTEQTDSPRVMDVVTGQNTLFEARRSTRESERELLRQRVRQLKSQIKGLQAQEQSYKNQITLLNQKLTGLRQLYEKGYAPLTRILALEREVERLDGERGAQVAEIARVRSTIGETEIELVRLGRSFKEEVIAELREVESEIVKLSEERIAVEDRLDRRDIYAPRSGFVLDLQVHTLGGVVAPGEPIMEIVPRNDNLVIAAQVLPQDIDKIAIGSEALIRFAAFNQRTTPEILGRVKTIAGDRLVDQATGQAYYAILVEVPEDARELLGGLVLIPGMPAEVFIKTGERSAINYFLKPLEDRLAHAFREE